MYKIYTIFLKKITTNFIMPVITVFQPKNSTLQNLIIKTFLEKSIYHSKIYL